MELHGMDVPTIVALALLSMVLTWMIAAYLDAKEEKRRDLELRKLMDRLMLRNTSSREDDLD